MRYQTISKLQPGTAVGQDVYDGDGRLLLTRHMILNEDYIKGLKNLRVAGIYIDDEFSEDVEVVEVLRPQVKQEALRMMNSMFLSTSKQPVSQRDMQNTVENVIGDIINNGDIMCNMLDVKTYDGYTYFHCVNVGVLSAIVGAGFHMSKQEISDLTMAATLHDVGKRFVDIDVLNAKRKLTEAERRIIWEHPQLGYDFLRQHYDFPTQVCTGVLQHHEGYDGHGYPLQTAGRGIPLYARIIKVADVYDALTSRRPYHEPMSPSEAVEYLMAGSGSEFDPEVLSVFMRKVAAYPTGCEVMLSDGRTAVVVKNYEDLALRPTIKVIPTGEIIHMKDDAEARNVTILGLCQ